ncbi:MAG TPA: hypothetical protein VIN71_11870 [Pseudomonadales bacterium]
MKNSTLLSLFLVMLMSLAVPAYAGLAVIVHPDNQNPLDERQLRNIFLGKSQVFADGSEARPLDLAEGSEERQAFVSKVLRRTESSLNAYWARMLFSSQGKPPKELKDASAVKQAVAADPQAIGYLDAADVDDTVRVLMIVE